MNAVMVVGGGSGGHVVTALAVAEAVVEKYPNIKVVFLGGREALEGERTLSIEQRMLSHRPFIFHTIHCAKFRRHKRLVNILGFPKFALGVVESISLIRQYQPRVCFLAGGFVSVPVVLACKIMRVPSVIHEQTAKAGLANRIAGNFATHILTSHASSQDYFPKYKTECVGNPVRQAIKRGMKDVLDQEYKKSNLLQYLKVAKDEPLPLLYVTGGAQGAHAINQVVSEALKELLNQFQIVHQCGRSVTYSDYERLKRIKLKLPVSLQKRYFLTQFVHDIEIGPLYHCASIMLCRSGAGTLNELGWFALPAVLVPLPHAQEGEQRVNALVYAKDYPAIVIEQDRLHADSLMTSLKMLQSQTGGKTDVPISYRKHTEDASSRIVEILSGYLSF